MPSILMGQEVVIKTREITQISSEISGVRGKIDVEEWHVGIVPLYESHSSHDLNIRARMAVGIRENVSGVVNRVEGTVASAHQFGDNEFAGVNTALAAYSTIRAATNLVQSGLISAGPMIGVDVSVSGGKMMRVSHAPNSVEFGELETSVPVPDMSVSEDMVSTSSYGISGGISNTGWNAFASVEGDGTRMGLGYSHAWEGAGVFGDEVWVIAGSSDNVLDATLASMDIGNFKQVWRDASLNSVMAQTEASVRRMIADAVTLADRVREMLGGERTPREPLFVGVYEELASTARVFVPARDRGTDDFYQALSNRESSGIHTKISERFHYIGLYQMGESALEDAGYYVKDNGVYNNDWTGRWTGKNGIHNREDFLNAPEKQTRAIKDYHDKIWNGLLRNYQKYDGQIIAGYNITKSGMIAAAHLVGHVHLKKFIDSNGIDNKSDGNMVPCTEYLKNFGGYNIEF